MMSLNIKRFSLFLLFVLFAAAPVYAQQDRDAQSLYEQASDTQIKEAQKFYRRCVQNETMSQRQDCKCAATEFIAKRIEMGDATPASEIMAANVNTCLKQEVFAQRLDGVSDFSEVTDEQLEEAQQVYKTCSADRYYYESYNCECIAAKFLDMRVSQGPVLDHSTILTRVRDTCPNVVDAVGDQYTSCMNPNSYLDIFEVIPQKEYCECYAREWARIFESYGQPVGRQTKGVINYSAYTTCRNPDRYR